MGGQIALHYLLYTLRSTTIRNRPEFAGVLLSSPFIALHPSTAPHWFTVRAGKLASKLAPGRQMAQKMDAQYMSRDPAVCREWTDDPLCHDTGTLAGMDGMLQRAADLVSLSQGQYVRSLTNELPCPVWMAHGSGDRVTSCKASQRLYDVLSAPGGDRSMRVFDDAYHKLEREPDGLSEAFIMEMGSWCERRARGERGVVEREGRKSLHAGRSANGGSSPGQGLSPTVSATNGGTKL